MNVAVIGASDKEDRYSYKAVKLLTQKGHRVFPIHQRIKEIDGIPVYSSLNEISDIVDTVSVYVSEDISTKLTNEILNKNPKRIIFNPGAENSTLETLAKQKGIKIINGCTLVMLNTNQF